MQKKKEEGITLVILTITVLVMIILSVNIVVNTKKHSDAKALTNLQNDLEVLTQRVNIYESKNDKLPILKEYPGSLNHIQSIRNINDNDVYYIIDLRLLSNITLNYGRGFYDYVDGGTSIDVYVINEKSHEIYYVQGVTVEDKRYYGNLDGSEKVEEISKIETDGSWNEDKEINSPNLDDTGLEDIIIDENGNIKEDEEYDYDYKEDKKNWANVITADGSMWVWIPRFAYKITYNSTNKSQGGKIDIVFLKDTTNFDKNGEDVTLPTYKDENGIIGAYTVHPAFRDGTSNQFSNGEWDREIEGFWVSKFEAGYAGGNNNANKVSTGITYGYNNSSSNFYGNITPNVTPMYYPVFMPKTYSYSDIIISDMYRLCKTLSKEGNPYKLSTNNVDSHMMKNSEWGAIAYLTQSKYGRGTEEVTINNVNLNNQIPRVNAVTGMAGETVSAAQNITTIEKINDGTSGSYSWDTEKGKKASTTNNTTGVYDLVGGMYEYTAGYINNNNASLENYGTNLINDGEKGKSTKYKSVYEYNASSDIHTNNYNKAPNPSRIGEAIWETSSDGRGYTSWNQDLSTFPNSVYPFFRRGGYYSQATGAGLYFFDGSGGGSGFRPILIVGK